LYFFSWGSLAACLYLVSSLLQEIRGINVIQQTDPKTLKWFILLASGLVAMGSASRIFKAGNCSSTLDGSFCRRTKFAVSAGVISFFLSFCVATMGLVRGLDLGFLGLLFELIVSGLLVILWCFGVGYITFGISPGHAIGNLYFSTWISFLVIILLFSDSLRQWWDHNPSAAQSTEGECENKRQASADQNIDDDI
jgi:hypothetical protein